MKRDTKLKGDLAEQIVICEALKRNVDVSIPVGDRLPYDLIFDVDGVLLKIQVKCAWFDKRASNYVVDTRMYKSNRKNCYHEKYSNRQFDFAIIVVLDTNSIYIMPSNVFNSYKSGITLAETDGRQRVPKSMAYKNNWDILSVSKGC
jgi:hypothetical protein